MKKIIALLTLIGSSAFAGTSIYNTTERDSAIANSLNQYGAYAYLTAESNTVLSVAETWYDVEGVFSNTYDSGFTVTTNGLTYTNGDLDFMIEGNVTAESGVNVTYIAFAISVNGVVVDASRQSRYFSTAKDRGSVSFAVHQMLSSGDVIRLVIRADKAQTVDTIGFQTWAVRF